MFPRPFASCIKLNRRRSDRPSHVAVGRPLRCESLERRALLAVLLVTNTNSEGAGSLAEAVEVANNQTTNPGLDIIRFARNVRGTIELTSELVVTDDVRIEGPGAQRLTVSGGNETRIMTLVSPDPSRTARAAIRDLTFADGRATEGGPLGPDFAIGGAIYNIGAMLSLDGMVFSNNVARGDVAAVAAGGAVANEFGGTLNVARSVFKDNHSEGILIGVGGAIASDIGPTADGAGTPRATLNVTGSTFDGNSAVAAFNNPVAAGGLAAFSGFAFGGAISSLATDARVLNSRFVNNSAQSGAGVDGENGGFANGGAIFSDDFSPFGVRDSFMEIRGSTFVGNAAMGGAAGPGGAVGGGAAGGAVSMSISFFEETGRIVNSNFSRNSAIGGPGATGGLAIGGALSVLTGADVDVLNSFFSENVVRGGDSVDGDGSGGDGIGGAIGLGQFQPAADSGGLLGGLPSVKITSTIFASNSASGGQGGATGVGGMGAGGALGVVSGEATVQLSSFTRNRALGGEAGTGGDAKGGAIYNSGASVSLARSIIFANMARGGEGEDKEGTGFGGGIFNDLENLDSSMDVDRLTHFFTKRNLADEGDNYFGV